MTIKLSAPVGDKKRTTKPDPRKPNEKFLPVRNNPADVELVRLMLKANGHDIEVNAKADTALVSAIQEFQRKKLGYRKPDGIVDPGGDTWLAGLPRLAAQIAADQRVEVYTVTEGGKQKLVAKSEYEKGAEALRRQLLSKASMMLGQAESWVGFCNDVEKTRQAADGLLDALVEFTVSVVNDKTDPPWTEILNARSETGLLKALASKPDPDWARVYRQDQAATAAYNKALKAFRTFIRERIETAGAIVGKLEIVRDTSFAIVEAYVTARLVATRGMSPAKAHAIAAASTEALKSGAGQLGEYLAGQTVTWDGAAKKVFIDSFIAGLAGAAGGKLGSALSNGLAKRLAAAVLPKLTGRISAQVGQAFFARFLQSKAGEAIVVNALKETIGLMKPLIEKGRAPNMNELREAVAKILTAGVMGTVAGGALKVFTDTFPSASAQFLQKSLAPSMMNGLRGDLVKLYGARTFEQLARDHAGEIYVAVAEQLSGKWVEKFAIDAINASDGNESPRQMQNLAEEAMRKDKKLRGRIEDMIQLQIADRARKLEPAH